MSELSNETLTEGLNHVRKAIDALCEQNKQAHKDIMDKQDKTNGRVRRLELYKSALAGGLAVVTLILTGGLVAAVVTTFLR